MIRLFTVCAGLLAALLLPGGVTAAGLNDTGITRCADNSSNNVACNNPNFPRQDAETGRDAQVGLGKAGAGPAGFDFTKLDSSGAPLDASAALWDCVRDNVTGLIWEIKTEHMTPDLRDQDWTYTWYNPDSNTNGGSAGPTGGATCGGFLSDQCNTQAYAAAVNTLTSKLCGFSDWRIPTYEELQTIGDSSTYNPTIASGYFPWTVSNWYWSASPYAPDAREAWCVNFHFGGDGGCLKGNNHAVRLVRGGP